jgi:hypothetical protein
MSVRQINVGELPNPPLPHDPEPSPVIPPSSDVGPPGPPGEPGPPGPPGPPGTGGGGGGGSWSQSLHLGNTTGTYNPIISAGTNLTFDGTYGGVYSQAFFNPGSTAQFKEGSTLDFLGSNGATPGSVATFHDGSSLKFTYAGGSGAHAFFDHGCHAIFGSTSLPSIDSYDSGAWFTSGSNARFGGGSVALFENGSELWFGVNWLTPEGTFSNVGKISCNGGPGSGQPLQIVMADDTGPHTSNSGSTGSFCRLFQASSSQGGYWQLYGGFYGGLSGPGPASIESNAASSSNAGYLTIQNGDFPGASTGFKVHTTPAYSGSAGSFNLTCGDFYLGSAINYGVVFSSTSASASAAGSWALDCGDFNDGTVGVTFSTSPASSSTAGSWSVYSGEKYVIGGLGINYGVSIYAQGASNTQSGGISISCGNLYSNTAGPYFSLNAAQIGSPGGKDTSGIVYLSVGHNAFGSHGCNVNFTGTSSTTGGSWSFSSGDIGLGNGSQLYGSGAQFYSGSAQLGQGANLSFGAGSSFLPQKITGSHLQTYGNNQLDDTTVDFVVAGVVSGDQLVITTTDGRAGHHVISSVTSTHLQVNFFDSIDAGTNATYAIYPASLSQGTSYSVNGGGTTQAGSFNLTTGDYGSVSNGGTFNGNSANANRSGAWYLNTGSLAGVGGNATFYMSAASSLGTPQAAGFDLTTGAGATGVLSGPFRIHLNSPADSTYAILQFFLIPATPASPGYAYLNGALLLDTQTVTPASPATLPLYSSAIWFQDGSTLPTPTSNYPEFRNDAGEIIRIAGEWEPYNITLAGQYGPFAATLKKIRYRLDFVSPPSSYTFYLPTTPYDGQQVMIKDVRGVASSYTWVISPGSGKTIDFGSNLTMTNYANYHLCYHRATSNWEIL